MKSRLGKNNTDGSYKGLLMYFGGTGDGCGAAQVQTLQGRYRRCCARGEGREGRQGPAMGLRAWSCVLRVHSTVLHACLRRDRLPRQHRAVLPKITLLLVPGPDLPVSHWPLAGCVGLGGTGQQSGAAAS